MCLWTSTVKQKMTGHVLSTETSKAALFKTLQKFDRIHKTMTQMKIKSG